MPGYVSADPSPIQLLANVPRESSGVHPTSWTPEPTWKTWNQSMTVDFQLVHAPGNEAIWEVDLHVGALCVFLPL